MYRYYNDLKRSKGQIIYMEYDIDGYKFHPVHRDNQPFIQVNYVKIQNRLLAEYLVSTKLNIKFNRIAQIVMQFLYDDSDDCDPDTESCGLLLDDVERLKRALELNYQKYLENRAYIDYIDKLTFLSNQLRQKMALLKYQEEIMYSESMGSRTR